MTASNLFDWQKSVAGSTLPPKVKLTAMLVIHGGDGVSGRNVVIRDEQLAATLGVSERTVWRHVEQLVGAGWLVQTAKPTQGPKGQPGRKARYASVIPELESSDTDEHETVKRSGLESSVISGESSDTDEHANGTVLLFSPASIPPKPPASGGPRQRRRRPGAFDRAAYRAGYRTLAEMEAEQTPPSQPPEPTDYVSLSTRPRPNALSPLGPQARQITPLAKARRRRVS